MRRFRKINIDYVHHLEISWSSLSCRNWVSSSVLELVVVRLVFEIIGECNVDGKWALSLGIFIRSFPLHESRSLTPSLKYLLRSSFVEGLHALGYQFQWESSRKSHFLMPGVLSHEICWFIMIKIVVVIANTKDSIFFQTQCKMKQK